MILNWDMALETFKLCLLLKWLTKSEDPVCGRSTSVNEGDVMPIF